MVDLQRIPAHGGRSQGARLLAAHKDKGGGGRLPGLAAGTPAYRGVASANPPPFSGTLVPPSPAVQGMPSRRDGSGSGRDSADAKGGGSPDPYELIVDDEEEERDRARPATTGKSLGLTVGKRTGGPMSGTEVKKQAQIHSLFSQQHKRIHASRLTPAGMVNLGNTCYLNSVVQVLLRMPSFTSDLLRPSLERLREHLPPAGVWSALLATLDKLRSASTSRLSFDSRKPAVEPAALRAAMGRRGRRWRSYAQQDAHEFLVELLEGLQSEVLGAEAAVTGCKRVRLSSTSCPVARNLGGCLVHTWTCSGCGRCSRSKEPFSCLSLQLPASGSVTLQDLVAEYLKDETIHKNCDGCSPAAAVAHTVQHRMWRLPRVLVVHIKRFMPLLQPPQPPQRASHPPHPELPGRQGEAAKLAAEAELAASDPEDSQTAKAAEGSAPGTHTRDDAGRHQPKAGPVPAGPGPGTCTPAPPQPAKAPASREASPQAPYLYAKLHTAVEVSASLDLSRHCDTGARAHVHLLEGLPPSALTRGTANAATVDATANADAASKPQVTPGGATLDTAGGASTCPSPSFQPNRSALQERTVQQPGRPQQLQHSRLGLTPGRPMGHCDPHESECGTSAMSTGHQADGEPTPHGGKAPPPLSAQRGRDQQQAQRAAGRQDADDADGGLFGFVRAQQDKPKVPRSCPARATTTPAVALGTPHGLWRPAGDEDSLEASQPTPVVQAASRRRQSNQTGNDEAGLQQQQPGSISRRPLCSASCLNTAEAVAAAMACSGRKGPKSLATGRFFGPGGGNPRSTPGESLAGGCGGGGGVGGGGDEQDRPRKRVCVDDLPGPSGGRRVPGTAAGTAQQAKMSPRLENLTEEEQLELALRLSLEDGALAAAAGAGGTSSDARGHNTGSAGKRHDQGLLTATAAGSSLPGSGAAPMLDLSVPTAAAGRGSVGLAAAAATPNKHRASASSDSAGDAMAVCGGGRHCAAWKPERESPPGRDRGHGSVCTAGEDDGDEQQVVELQDESPGGIGVGGGKAGRRSKAERRRDSRPPGSNAALSGASGSSGENDGDHDSDCVGTAPGASDGGATVERCRMDRRRIARKRRHLTYPAVEVPDYAESPAVPPIHCRRVDGGGDNVVQYVGDDEDDGTTAQSPITAGRQRYAGGGVRNAGTMADGRTEGPDEGDDAAGGGEAAAADDEEEMREVMRLSMETFAKEEAARKARHNSCGGGATTGVEDTWQKVLSLPDADQEAQEPLMQQTACDTRHAGGMDALAAVAGLCAQEHGSGAKGGPSSGAAGNQLGSVGRRRQASPRKTDAGPSAEVGAAGQEDFRFNFVTQGNGDGDDSAKGVIDLTSDCAGVDDEDAELNKAILLSLQEQEQQWMDVGSDDGANNAGGVDADAAAGGGSGSDGDNAKAAKPKVALIADSDCEEGAVEEAAEAGKTTIPATSGAAVTQQVEASPSERARLSGGGGSTSSVPLSQLARYRLHGVVRHKGLTPYSGHYVADALVVTEDRDHREQEMWFEHNDSVVSHVDFSRVREDAAKQGYMLFFVNAGTRAVVSPSMVAAAAEVPLPDDVTPGAAKSA
ncbi:hypothetical protein Agub_g15361 [Astrephomene gubernaculifera]|uniref:USP domain-containing protein n=1 Tax=Astrephomene gubernaculifera TaxID=47775 RepID=A0AAD3E343_9CHLO|nr:hypothetical protein Agub_g15361 [Astrephomene gubernaculifera]